MGPSQPSQERPYAVRPGRADGRQARWYRGATGTPGGRRPRAEQKPPRHDRSAGADPTDDASSDADPPASPPARASPRSRSACSSTGTRTAPSRRRSRAATPARTATTSSSSTTARRSPTACRTTATCSPATSRTSSRATRPCAARRVERRFGWDTHGLPAELEAQRQLGIKTKEEILELGIEKFNAACRESVLKYTDEWQDYVTRQARWVDFENDYKTLDPDYMESVIWAFKSCTTRAWSTRASASCPTAGTTRRRCPTTSCGWTTTSTRCARTRPSRLDAARDRRARPGLDDHAVDPAVQPRLVVGPDIDYVVVESDSPGARALRPRRGAAGGLREGAWRRRRPEEQVVERLKGTDLVGRSTRRRSTSSLGTAKRAPRPRRPTFVTTEDGTGLVHIAPAPSARTTRSSRDAAGIEPVVPVGPDGRFTSRSPTTRACRSSRPTRRSSTTSRRAPAARATTAR